MKEASKKKTEKVADMVRRMMWRFRPVQVKCEKPTIEGTLICHLNLLESVIMRRANSAVAVEGLTFQQWVALGAVAHRAEQGIRHTELGALLRLSKAPVTGMVDRLERAGWVMRKPDAEDRRASRIMVTSDGVEVWQRAHHVMRKSSQELFEGLDDTEKYQLLSILGHLLDNASTTEDIPELSEEAYSVGELR